MWFIFTKKNVRKILKTKYQKDYLFLNTNFSHYLYFSQVSCDAKALMQNMPVHFLSGGVVKSIPWVLTEHPQIVPTCKTLQTLSQSQILSTSTWNKHHH